MASIIQLRRDTAANWLAADPVLADGEMGLEWDTSKLKIGNGVDTWSILAYYGGGGGAEWGTITGALESQSDLQAALDAKISDAPIDGNLYGRKDGGWEPVPGASSNDLAIITEAGAFTVAPATQSGRHRLILAGGDVTFDAAENYASGNVFNLIATAGLNLLTTGVTLTPPAGGTLDLLADMAVSIVMTSANTGRIIGQTVPA